MLEVSWSKVRTWRRCHRQYRYKYVERLQRKSPKVQLFKGRILHEMLDARATGVDPQTILDRYAKEYRKLFLEEREVYGDLIGDLSRIFAAYQRQYATEELKVVKSEAFVATQITKKIRFIGYIDKVVANTRTWIMDHKTGRHIPNEDARFSDLQLLFYGWAWNRENPSNMATGVIWDYLKTKPPTIPEVLKSGELSRRVNIETDRFTYLKAIKDASLDPGNYQEELDRLGKQVSPFFKRVTLPNPPKVMVETVVEDMRKTAVEVLHLGEIADDRNMTRECSSCEYFQVCHADLRGHDAEYVRKAQYTVKEATEHGDEEDTEPTS